MEQFRFEKHLSRVIFALLGLGSAVELPLAFGSLVRMSAESLANLSFWEKIGHILAEFWYGGNVFTVLLAPPDPDSRASLSRAGYHRKTTVLCQNHDRRCCWRVFSFSGFVCDDI